MAQNRAVGESYDFIALNSLCERKLQAPLMCAKALAVNLIDVFQVRLLFDAITSISSASTEVRVFEAKIARKPFTLTTVHPNVFRSK